MEPKTKKVLIITGIGISSVLTLALTASLVIPVIIAKKDEDKTDKLKENETPNNPNEMGVYPKTVVNPIGDRSEVKIFQDWMDLKHLNWLDNGQSLNKGNGYGVYGSQTKKAYAKYGQEYSTQSNIKPYKILKSYANRDKTGIWNKFPNIITGLRPPNHYATKGEYVGNFTRKIEKAYNGLQYIQLSYPDGTIKWARIGTVTFNS